MKKMTVFFLLLWLMANVWAVQADEQGYTREYYRPHHPKERRQYHAGQIFVEPVTHMAFVYFPSGCFTMGCSDDDKRCSKDEKPGHVVCLDGFWISKCEVSQRVWQDIMGSNPSFFKGNPDRPVESVSFDEVQQFVRQLNVRIQDRVSLPTEAQWEYACRNGKKNTRYSWGNEEAGAAANCGTCNPGNIQQETSECGFWGEGISGLCDMGGNVKEWCRDIYDKKAYSRHREKNPIYQKRGSSRVVRGGSFADNLSGLRCRARDKSIPAAKSRLIGFRLVLERKPPLQHQGAGR